MYVSSNNWFQTQNILPVLRQINRVEFISDGIHQPLILFRHVNENALLGDYVETATVLIMEYYLCFPIKYPTSDIKLLLFLIFI